MMLSSLRSRRGAPRRASFALAASVAIGGVASVHFVGCGGSEFVAAPTDGGPVSDAGASPLPFCSTIDADFCSDFDEAPLPENWTTVSATGGASGSENGDASVSPPSSYLAVVPAFPVGDGGITPAGGAVLQRTGLVKGQSRIAFAMRIDQLTFTAANALTSSVFVAEYTQGQAYKLALEFHPAAGNAVPFGAGLLETTTPAVGPPTTKLDDLPNMFTAIGVWYEVAIDFGIDSADAGEVPASISVTPANGNTTTKLITLTVPLDSVGGDRTFSVGAESLAPVGPVQIRFDNVTYSH
jgi:hypothetical protein